jgi:hypothetical protein
MQSDFWLIYKSRENNRSCHNCGACVTRVYNGAISQPSGQIPSIRDPSSLSCLLSSTRRRALPPFCSGDLLTLTVEKNPLDGRADFAVTLRMAPLDVVLHVPLFAQGAAFFRIPSTIDLSEMSAATRSSLQQLAVKAKQQLVLAWEHSTTLDLHCDMQVLAGQGSVLGLCSFFLFG